MSGALCLGGVMTVNRRYVQQRETNSNRPHWKPFTPPARSWPVFTGKNAGFSVIRDEEFPNANKALDAKVKFLKKPGKRKKPNAVEKGFTPVYTYFATTICHFARCRTLKVKLFFIHQFLARLSAFVESYYSPSGPLGKTPARFYYRNATFWAEFGYVKYLIVPFWYASEAYQACLVSPWVPWLDQSRLICRRSVPKIYVGLFFLYFFIKCPQPRFQDLSSYRDARPWERGWYALA